MERLLKRNAIAFSLCVGLISVGCDDIDRTVDNINSSTSCNDYCDKKFACQNKEPNDTEFNSCSDGCRNSIENNCGNEHQAAANDKISECVDKGCAEFTACMVFSAAPTCFGFVNNK